MYLLQPVLPMQWRIYKKDFNQKYPDVEIFYNADSSGTLQTQIEEGLEADVFMSAAAKQMTALDGEGMIESDTITSLLENKIVLIVPTGSSAGIEKFEDIEKAETIASGILPACRPDSMQRKPLPAWESGIRYRTR